MLAESMLKVFIGISHASVMGCDRKPLADAFRPVVSGTQILARACQQGDGRLKDCSGDLKTHRSVAGDRKQLQTCLLIMFIDQAYR